ncbi:MAG: hypothetical protein AUH43_20225 [Acidobacteria bacterium 13_1_40CM_65_14]|nr:MAG: hypothetical protein AUH43_20225 [Acidobacteria bacterium 13_1_40CM_65_14]OLC83827.1 MAG: hypothetical protein AUH72_03365 [Acidobacteria bacterium 13_1_40CM_4_65_8]OLE84437.1 MAG: hypothetical protein AUF76_03390 [Acidobacteria bacterium 13_1_20CM_2_65_9]
MRRMFIKIVTLTASLLAAGLTFTTPHGWQQTQPGSSMRVAEFTLPRAAGDGEDAQLVVYYFGGAGGSVNANIDRWVGQMQQPDGKPSSAVAKKQTRTVNGLAVSLVDVDGTYVAETAPGSTERHNKPNFRLRAGVVQTANGPYFIKLTGPAKTVSSWDRAYDQFVSSLKFQ